MSSTVAATLVLAAALPAQHPATGSNAAPAISPQEVARLESQHLKNIRQVTSGFGKARRCFRTNSF